MLLGRLLAWKCCSGFDWKSFSFSPVSWWSLSMCINWIYIIRWFSCLNLRVYHFCGKKEHAVFTYMYRCQKGTKLVSYSLLFCTFCMNCGTLYINFFCKIIRYVYSSKTLIQKCPCIFLCNPANCMTGTGQKNKWKETCK